jgi:hypothetical protein
VIVGAAFEAPAVVASFHDVAMVSEAIEQRCCHFGIAKDTRPFAKIEVCSDDDGGPLVEPADEMEQKLPAGLRERQIAELVK